MNPPPLTPAELDQVLAAELALGLLDGQEASAAKARQDSDPAFAALVRDWQEQFAGMAGELTPVMAPARARQRVREKLGHSTAPLTEDPTEKTPWYRGPVGFIGLILIVVAVLAYLWQLDVW